VRADRPLVPAAFTLIELAVVVVIIATLAGILIPGIGYFRKTQRRAAITSFIGAIQTGLVGYQQDYRDLPPSGIQPPATSLYAFGIVNTGSPANVAAWDGGELLTAALAGPLPDVPGGDYTLGDGQPGFGFKPVNGRRSGPYFEIKNDKNLRRSPVRPTEAFILTMYYSRYEGLGPFLYYRAYAPQGANIGQTGDFLTPTGTLNNNRIFGPRGRFDTDDNNDLDGANDPSAHWQRTAAQGLKSEVREAFVTELRGADYLIVHPGPDEEFGRNTTADRERTLDDVFVTGAATR